MSGGLTPEQRADLEHVPRVIRSLEAREVREREADAGRALHHAEDQTPLLAHAQRRRRVGGVRFAAATETEDRGVRLDMDGVDLTSYRRNPVILWRHGRDAFPIGRCDDMHVDGARLIADVRWDLRDRLGREVGRRYRRGMLHAVSLGYTPLDYSMDDDGLLVITRWRVLELSCCTLPADRNAVRDEVKAPSPLAAVADLLRGPR